MNDGTDGDGDDNNDGDGDTDGDGMNETCTACIWKKEPVRAVACLCSLANLARMSAGTLLLI